MREHADCLELHIEQFQNCRQQSLIHRVVLGDPMKTILANLHKSESGQDLVEYSLIMLSFGLAWVAAAHSLSSSIAQVFNNVGSTLTSAN